ncbi:MAG TPA: hypothetical protein VLG92_03575 [Candidatus Saccharimonadia bacterium]|nr:hypothetical protein [Candidatus Saccharimonadia bacterium]
MPKVNKRSALLFTRVSVFIFCGLISLYLLASGYESVYNRPLPFVHTISSVNLSAFTSVYHLNTLVPIPKNAYYGNFGKPSTLKLPATSVRLNIVGAIKDNVTWLARPSTLQLAIPSPPRSGNIGVAFLYCHGGFRTINTENMPTVGQNIFIDTDENWRYIYKVVAAHAFQGITPYIPSDSGTTGKLLIDCYDSGSRTNIIVEANLLSVIGADQ